MNRREQVSMLVEFITKFTPERFAEFPKDRIIREYLLDESTYDAVKEIIGIKNKYEQSASSTGPRWYDSSEHVKIDTSPSFVSGLIYKGAVTAIIGKPKVGKTTFIMDMCEAVTACKKFIGLDTTPANILYVTEQGLASFQPELSNSGLVNTKKQRKKLLYLPVSEWFRYQWPDIVNMIGDKASATSSEMLVFDTFSRIARVKDENDASEMQAAVDKMNPLTAAGIGSVLSQHERKSGGDISDAGRGTNALTGAVDVLLRLMKTGGEGRDNSRMLEFSGRLPGPDSAIALRRRTQNERSRYESMGSASAMKRLIEEDAVVKAVSASPMTEKEICEELEGKRSTVKRVIGELLKQGRIKQSGEGTKESPFKYEEVVQAPEDYAEEHFPPSKDEPGLGDD